MTAAPCTRHAPSARICPALAIVLTLLLAGCGDAREVEVVSPRRGEIHESFMEPARTRLRNTWPITMPVAGRIGRVDHEPGDPAPLGAELAAYDRVPFDQAVAEALAVVEELRAQIAVREHVDVELTSLEEARRRVEATSETLKAAEQAIASRQARADTATRKLERQRRLFEEGMVSDTAIEDAQLEAETAVIDLRSAQFDYAALHANAAAGSLAPLTIEQTLARRPLEVAVLARQLEAAEARLARAEHDRGLASIQSPIDGVVLERFELGNASLPAGTRLLLLGDLDELEVIADVLTQDALRLRPGSRVELVPAARADAIAGEVTRIEPAGFTKLSSLGVEQQRVNAIVAFREPPTNLGVGYRLEARFFTGSKQDALVVPRFSVLQAPDGSHYVFVVEGGDTLRRRPVTIGLRSDLDMEILDGLAAADVLVRTPDTSLDDGQSVKPLARQ